MWWEGVRGSAAKSASLDSPAVELQIRYPNLVENDASQTCQSVELQVLEKASRRCDMPTSLIVCHLCRQDTLNRNPHTPLPLSILAGFPSVIYQATACD